MKLPKDKFNQLGPVARRLISTDSGLTFNPGYFISKVFKTGRRFLALSMFFNKLKICPEMHAVTKMTNLTKFC